MCESVLYQNYLFITYIVTSKPNLISVAAGLVHIVFLLKFRFCITCNTVRRIVTKDSIEVSNEMYEFEVIKVKKPSERDWAFPRRVPKN